MEEPVVDQLIVGHSRKVGEHFSANGSVTLIRTSAVNILVDCGDPWSRDEILRKLSSLGMRSDDVHVLVITHGHLDHCGNLSLFPRSTIYMATDVAYEGNYSTLSEDKPVQLTPEVELRFCTGHTDHDLIVVANGTQHGCVVVAGDIFEYANDDEDWKEVSHYPDMQSKSRAEILRYADWIVPGHGPMFKNERGDT
ncbi:Metallo-beta-lactamase domain-containing protein 1 [Parelaphostrongylus tenuis]|uniref:Metallo-beta-lactamase domain-containing protein 1 n=1 Tax=Parelaphostrongylus tenuis TaxID=148309 RepID=A0AAD5N4P4_PARTN|nr:Metallo-beta-lactamase domain-containing protein 1 [Parelaphostrongylus tenuis]